jgi:N-acylneuraminate cytidylyltransferase
MKILCVIPVRGGSKGIVRKNAMLTNGKPLVTWTIEQALEVDGLEVVVSTDDPNLAAIAESAGAKVPFMRPSQLAQDETPTEPVILHVLDYYESLGEKPDAVMLLQATSPVRFPGTLSRAVEQFARTGVDSLVGVVAQTPFLWKIDGGAQPEPLYDFKNRLRRQQFSADQLLYRETGSLYITKTEIYRQQSNRIGGNVGLFVMDEVEGSDIDTLADYAIAEKHLSQIYGNHSAGESS